VCRMAARDGLSPEPDHPEQQRYLDAQRLYRDACRPRESADIVVDNTDLERPILTLA
jgi:uridine kinase